jgi:hypothetical protein
MGVVDPSTIHLRQQSSGGGVREVVPMSEAPTRRMACLPTSESSGFHEVEFDPEKKGFVLYGT